MARQQGPIGEDGVYRSSDCSFRDVTGDASEDHAMCRHSGNASRRCAVGDCPLVSETDREAERTRRQIIAHTPPSRENRAIDFGDPAPAGRIRKPCGRRILEWAGTEWLAYEKKDLRWSAASLSEDDYETLWRELSAQLRAILH